MPGQREPRESWLRYPAPNGLPTHVDVLVCPLQVADAIAAFRTRDRDRAVRSLVGNSEPAHPGARWIPSACAMSALQLDRLPTNLP
jgi:hypothetical protein